MTRVAAIALLAVIGVTDGFFVGPGARLGQVKTVSSMRMSTETASSNVVPAEELQVRNPPGDVKLDQAVLDRYMSLPQKNMVQAEYIWIGGTGLDLRCKTRTLNGKVTDVSKLPKWNYDGSSTGQAPGTDSEVLLVPVKIYPDPFRGGDNILVLCEAMTPAGEPIPSNSRAKARKAFDAVEGLEPWYGIEQEYTLFDKDMVTPFGWPKEGLPGPQGPYYCSVGFENAFGRGVAEAHYRACMYADIPISGINAEVMPGQWEYQVGPAVGINAADDIVVSRFLLQRVGEDLGVVVSFDPKPIPGDWNGAGCHTNFSTKQMRETNGYKAIVEAIEKLGKRHVQHIKAYGEGNERRLTGQHETASINSFSYGVADRGASIRIPRAAEAEGKGYFEDRRPASNMDPYVVTGMIYDTCCVWDGKDE
ncbi:unnamed protein product [Discosporangium mesarthrocarpum]